MRINKRFPQFLALMLLLLLGSGCSARFAFADTAKGSAKAQPADDPQAELAYAEEVIKKDPNSDRAHYSRGYALFKLERFREASMAFQEAIRINPRHENAHILLGETYSRLDQFEAALSEFDNAIKINPKDVAYRCFRDALAGYVKLRKTQNATYQPAVATDADDEYATSVYEGMFSEALVHHDFDLIDKAANEARASKDRIPGGHWKLQLIYNGVDHPYISSSDYEWNQHIELLKQWAAQKPGSQTANMALATCYTKFAWDARGNGYAKEVSDNKWQLFNERMKLAKEVVLAAKTEPLCPKWYVVMNEIAITKGWDKESFDKLFNEAVQHEPEWYEYYRQKATYLLPRWHGEPGELDAFVNSFAVNGSRKDSAMLYFLLTEHVGAVDPEEAKKTVAHYEVLKQGYFDLRKAYGVNARDTAWVFNKALQANDVALAKEVFPEFKGSVPDGGARVTKEMFDELVKQYAEQQKKTP